MCPQTRAVESEARRPGDRLAASISGLSVLILIGFLWSGVFGRLAQALLVTSMPVLLILLGRARNTSRRLWVAMAVLWLLLGGSWAALIWAAGAGVPLLAGVPLVLWILVFGLGILPLALVSWVHAATFAANEPVTESRDGGDGSTDSPDNGSS